MKTKKEEYIDKMTAQLKEWSAKIDELEAKVDTTKTGVKLGYDRRILDLREKRTAVTQKLAELMDSSAEAWVATKAGVDTAWKEFKDGLTNAKDKFKKAA
jgi:chorismate mutase